MSDKNVTEDRDIYVGGSDMPYILGLADKKGYGSAYEFALEKTKIKEREFTGNQFTEYGKLLEPKIISYINDKYDVNYKEESKKDEERKLRANVDGWDKPNNLPIVEVKTYGKKGFDADYYIPQCMFYMFVYGVKKCWLISYKRPDDFYTGIDYDLESSHDFFNSEFDEASLTTQVVEFDQEAWDKMYDEIVRFQNACKELKANPEMTKEEFDKLIDSNEVARLKNQLEELEVKLIEFDVFKRKHSELKEKLFEAMTLAGKPKLQTNTMTISAVAEKITTTDNFNEIELEKQMPTLYSQYVEEIKVTRFDEDKFKNEQLDSYNRFVEQKESKRKGYLQVRIKPEVKAEIENKLKELE